MKILRLKNLIFSVLALAMLFLGKVAMADTMLGDFTFVSVGSGSSGAASGSFTVNIPSNYPSIETVLLCVSGPYGNSITSFNLDGFGMTNYGEYGSGNWKENYWVRKIVTPGVHTVSYTFSSSNSYAQGAWCWAVKGVDTSINPTTISNTWTNYECQNNNNDTSYSNITIPAGSFIWGGEINYSWGSCSSNCPAYSWGNGMTRISFNDDYYDHHLNGYQLAQASPNNYVRFTRFVSNCVTSNRTMKALAFIKKPNVMITNPTEGQTFSNLFDKTLTIEGSCKTNGTNQLALQPYYATPIVQPTCDCVNGSFSCQYTFDSWDASRVCVIDKDDTSSYSCRNVTLYRAQLQTNYGTNPYFTAMPWSCDILGCRFPLASNASWAFEYSYDQDITPYSQYNAPFIVRPLNVPLNSTSTKLYVAEITNPYVVCNNCTSSYQVIQTLSNTTLNNLTATSSGFMYGGFDISTSTRYFLVSLKSATSTTIYQKQYISLSYSAAERPSGQPDFIWFQNTKDKLKGKLIFAQVFAFSDALNAFLNSTSTQASPLTFTMKSMSANNQFNLDIPVFDFTNPTVLNFAQRMRPLFIAGIWISFGFYLWNMFTKRLFRDDG